MIPMTKKHEGTAASRSRRARLLPCVAGFLGLVFLVTGCATAPSSDSGGAQAGIRPHKKIGNPYVIDGRQYVPAVNTRYVEEGVASWYGPKFHGKPTANGEMFDMTALTAAHRTLPLPSIAEVTNLRNGKKVVVRVNDRGPFARDRIIDLSRAAARKLDFIQQGTARVRVRYLRDASLEAALLRVGDRQAINRLERELRSLPRRQQRNGRRTQNEGAFSGSSADPVSSLIQRSLADAPSVAPNPRRVVSTTRASRPATEAVFHVQIGAFRDLNRAETVRLALGPQVPVSIVPMAASGAPAVYRVLAGRFGTRADADAYLRAVRSAGYTDAWVSTVAGPAPRPGLDY
ncbi:MAG: septal ring lytic transglycosylase RlpA family protein [Pseudomonadota bacterium]